MNLESAEGKPNQHGEAGQISRRVLWTHDSFIAQLAARKLALLFL